MNQVSPCEMMAGLSLSVYSGNSVKMRSQNNFAAWKISFAVTSRSGSVLNGTWSFQAAPFFPCIKKKEIEELFEEKDSVVGVFSPFLIP